MEIKREVFGQEISIKLTDSEIVEAYREYKKELAYEEVYDVLSNWDLGEVLKSCNFPYPGFTYILDEKIKAAENMILENKKLLLAISENLIEPVDTPARWHEIEEDAEKILSKWGEEHPDFLKQFEDIRAVAYEKYKAAWTKERNYSEEFLAEIRKEFKEEVKEFGSPSCFEEYIDEYGYHGELYVCFEEFLDAEYLDAEYMKELLSEAEYAEYRNDCEIDVLVLEFAKLYEEKELKYLTNAIGEQNEMPPQALFEWYENIDLAPLYLVELKGEKGILAINEYDDCYCEDVFQNNKELMATFVSEKAEQIRQDEKLKGYQVLKGFGTGFAGCDEIGLFIPYPMNKEKVKELLSVLDEMGYEGAREFVESREKQEFHKGYADYSELRKTLQNSTYDLMQDSIGQWSVGKYSTDITVRDYDGKLCIDYDVYENGKHLDGGKVCGVKDMPVAEKGFVELIDRAVDKHLSAVLKKEMEQKASLEGKLKDAKDRVGEKNVKDVKERVQKSMSVL